MILCIDSSGVILLVQREPFLPTKLKMHRTVVMYLLTTAFQEVGRIILFQNVHTSMEMLMFNNKEFDF